MSNDYHEEQMAKWEPVEVDESEEGNADSGEVVNEENADVQTG